MINIARDPKGYYIALGIAEDADGAAIKSAFRSRAKRLHPDFNPSPVAAKQFHRLHEAYATHPERFVRHAPVPPTLPGPAWINKPTEV